MSGNRLLGDKISESFESFIQSGTSRSTAKLKPLHGAIAEDIAARRGKDYAVLSQGYGMGREASIEGRYLEKRVDIAICENATMRRIAGIAVKFVMQNYSQNSNNYFENMLGETANIRAAHHPYFQIFIIPDKLPYFKNSGTLSDWEEFTGHNMEKYRRLSCDDTGRFCHTPDKTLIYVVHVEPDASLYAVASKAEYLDFYRANAPRVLLTGHKYPSLTADGTVILNDYEKFMDKVYHTVLAR